MCILLNVCLEEVLCVDNLLGNRLYVSFEIPLNFKCSKTFPYVIFLSLSTVFAFVFPFISITYFVCVWLYFLCFTKNDDPGFLCLINNLFSKWYKTPYTTEWSVLIIFDSSITLFISQISGSFSLYFLLESGRVTLQYHQMVGGFKN